MIKGKIVLTEIQRILRGRKKSDYTKIPQGVRKRAVNIHTTKLKTRECDTPAPIIFSICEFVFLFELIYNSLSAECKHHADELAVLIMDMLTWKPVKVGGSSYGLVRVDPSTVVFDPSKPSLDPIPTKGEEYDSGHPEDTEAF